MLSGCNWFYTMWISTPFIMTGVYTWLIHFFKHGHRTHVVYYASTFAQCCCPFLSLTPHRQCDSDEAPPDCMGSRHFFESDGIIMTCTMLVVSSIEWCTDSTLSWRNVYVTVSEKMWHSAQNMNFQLVVPTDRAKPAL